MAETQDPIGLRAPAAAAYARPVAEWLVWISLAAAVYAQTGFFDEEIPNYAFGATGWPRALCWLTAAGATGQLLTRVLAIHRGEAVETDSAAERPSAPGWRAIAHRAAIMLFPFVYLFFVPTIGFYVATPLFILGLLLLLDVRNPITLLGVTAIVYTIVLLIFARFFYVALPVGTTQPFYDWNNTIIVLVRTGV